MTREEILAEVKRLGPWFHRIELSHGISTKEVTVAGEPPDHPRATWELIRQFIPEDLAGKDALDVGCNAGFYAVEAKRRRARRVLGVDAQRFHIRQARFVRRALKLDIEFERLSVYDLDPHRIGQFDLTLALGLIYHCKHPALALERLARVTRETLIVETAILPLALRRPSQSHNIGGLMRRLHPAAFVENPLEAKEEVYNWFLPSVECLRVMLRAVGFADIAAHANGEERVVLICRKTEACADSRTLSDLSAELSLLESPASCRPAEPVRFLLRARNTGYARWLAHGETETQKAAVLLAAHILSATGERDIFWCHATAPIARDVAPGEATELEIIVRAPDQPGSYVIEFDMASNHLGWFEDSGSQTLRRVLQVIASETG